MTGAPLGSGSIGVVFELRDDAFYVDELVPNSGAAKSGQVRISLGHHGHLEVLLKWESESN